jgi:hypothetical protein
MGFIGAAAILARFSYSSGEQPAYLNVFRSDMHMDVQRDAVSRSGTPEQGNAAVQRPGAPTLRSGAKHGAVAEQEIGEL